MDANGRFPRRYNSESAHQETVRMSYRAPVQTIRWALDIAGYATVQQQSAFTEASDDLVDAVLEEAAKFAE